MGLRDVLFGKKKLAGPARERLFALTTAAVTLQTELGLRTAGVGGICFKPLSAGDFVRAESDLQQLLDGIAAENAKPRRKIARFETDSFTPNHDRSDVAHQEDRCRVQEGGASWF